MAGSLPWLAVSAAAALWLALGSWSSKADEFMADAGAAALTGDPKSVSSALGKTSALADGDLALSLWLRPFWRNPPTAARLRRLR